MAMDGIAICVMTFAVTSLIWTGVLICVVHALIDDSRKERLRASRIEDELCSMVFAAAAARQRADAAAEAK